MPYAHLQKHTHTYEYIYTRLQGVLIEFADQVMGVLLSSLLV